MILAPSILAANFAHLYDDIMMLNQSEADWLHIDVMDGKFVPNISFGFPVIEAIKQYAQKPLDIHLMIENPDRYLADFVRVGAQWLTVHYEACPHLHRTVRAIRDMGIKAGIALNPHTPVSVLSELLYDIDLVCIMSVNPGFGGQKFIVNTYKKIEQLKKMIVAENVAVQIEIDGGVALDNASLLLGAGADVLVAGSSIFQAPTPIEMIQRLKKC